MKKIILPLICLLLFATCKKEEEEIIIPSITYPTFEGYILTDIDGTTLGNQGNDTTDWELKSPMQSPTVLLTRTAIICVCLRGRLTTTRMSWTQRSNIKRACVSMGIPKMAAANAWLLQRTTPSNITRSCGICWLQPTASKRCGNVTKKT